MSHGNTCTCSRRSQTVTAALAAAVTCNHCMVRPWIHPRCTRQKVLTCCISTDIQSHDPTWQLLSCHTCVVNTHLKVLTCNISIDAPTCTLSAGCSCHVCARRTHSSNGNPFQPVTKQGSQGSQPTGSSASNCHKGNPICGMLLFSGLPGYRPIAAAAAGLGVVGRLWLSRPLSTLVPRPKPAAAAPARTLLTAFRCTC